MLVSERVSLGPLVAKDMAALFQWRNSPELATSRGPFRPVDQAEFTEWLAGAKLSLPRVLLIIRKNADGALLGYVEIYNIDAVSRSAEFGIAIADPANRDQGYGREATRLALAFCWSDLNLWRMSLRVIGDNPAALAMYRRAGFETEALLRRAAGADGQFQDVTVMGVLRPH